jgi:hypothetical protein
MVAGFATSTYRPMIAASNHMMAAGSCIDTVQPGSPKSGGVARPLVGGADPRQTAYAMGW